MIMYTRDYIVLGLLTVAILLFSVSIGFQFVYVTDGMEYDRLRNSIQKLETENALLQEQIYEASSFKTLELKAHEQGFIEAKEYYYLD